MRSLGRRGLDIGRERNIPKFDGSRNINRDIAATVESFVVDFGNGLAINRRWDGDAVGGADILDDNDAPVRRFEVVKLVVVGFRNKNLLSKLA